MAAIKISPRTVNLDITKKYFAKHHKKIKSVVTSKNQNWKLEVSKAIKAAYHDLDPTLTNSDVIDIAVSYDGTWQKRGHQSHTGVGIAIDTLTGLVVDFEVLSSYCDICTKARRKLDAAGFSEWYISHTRKDEC